MADPRLIPDSIRDERSLALNDLIGRAATLDLTPLLVYLIDTVEESALIHLADQFGVSGQKGWDFASTTQQKRGLIRNAIWLHQYKGTPFAIKRALAEIGHESAVLTERFPEVTYNGTTTHSGNEKYDGAVRWASFKVSIPTGSTVVDAIIIRKIINEYKNFRSRLRVIEMKTVLNDSVNASDEFCANAAYPEEFVCAVVPSDSLGITLTYAEILTESPMIGDLLSQVDFDHAQLLISSDLNNKVGIEDDFTFSIEPN